MNKKTPLISDEQTPAVTDPEKLSGPKKFNWKQILLTLVLPLGIFLILFLLDLISKTIIMNNVPVNTKFGEIPNFINFIYVNNTGMFFGILADATWGRILLAIISGVASVGISIYFALRFKKLNLFMKILLMVILAGAFGNFVDRAFYPNGVVDFIQFVFWAPIFNLADSFLVVGIIALVVYMIVTMIIEAVKKNPKTEGGKVLSEAEIEALKKSSEESLPPPTEQDKKEK